MIPTTRDELELVVDAAVRAPSVHNTQPWRFTLADSGLTLRADRHRLLSNLDPDGRQLHLSCGAALMHARLAVRAAGRQPRVRLLPDPDDRDVLAELTLGEPAEATPDEVALDAAAAVRHTFRGSFRDDDLPDGLIRTLRRAAASEGAFVHPVTRREDQLVAAALLARADETERQDPAYREELRAWTREASGAPDGVPLAPSPLAMDDVFTLRDFGSGGHGRWGRGGTVLVLATDTDDATAWLQAGQALALVLLELTRAGAAASPLGQVLDLPDSRARLRTLLGLGGYPQMLLRVGLPDPGGDPGRPSGRRPVSDVLDLDRD